MNRYGAALFALTFLAVALGYRAGGLKGAWGVVITVVLLILVTVANAGVHLLSDHLDYRRGREAVSELRLNWSYALEGVPSQRLEFVWPRLGEMAAVIAEAEILVKDDGTAPSAREVLCYSPRGEVLMLYTWYPMAASVTGRLREVVR